MSEIAFYTDSNNVSAASVSRNTQNNKEDFDVLFIGDSRCHQGLDPRIFNRIYELETGNQISSLNLGRPGLQAPFAYFILENYLNKAKHPPKAVVINFSFYLLGGKQWMRDIYYAYFYPTLPQTWDTYKSELSNPLRALAWYPMTHIPMLRYLKRMRVDSNNFFKADSKTFWNNVVDVIDFRRTQYDPSYYGYRPRGNKFITKEDVELGGYNKGYEQGYDVFFYYMRRLYELAQKHNIKVILYEFPWPEPRDNKEFHEILAYYQDILKKNSMPYNNASWVDYEYFWPIEYFVDPLHVNNQGAEKLTKLAVNWVAELQGLSLERQNDQAISTDPR